VEHNANRKEVAMAGGETFELAPWYPSEAAKRALGNICDAIFLQETPMAVGLLGTEAEPLLLLESLPTEPNDEEISLDEARADWSNVTLAAAIYGTRFCIKKRRNSPDRKGLTLAVLYRHPKARHPVERYLRSASPDVERLAQQIEALARDVRKLGQGLAVPEYP
jgi:hypothetical protein